MGEFTEHNWREKTEEVVRHVPRGRKRATSQAEFYTKYSEKCTRCGCVRFRVGVYRGVAWEYPDGTTVMPRCVSKRVSTT